LLRDRSAKLRADGREVGGGGVESPPEKVETDGETMGIGGTGMACDSGEFPSMVLAELKIGVGLVCCDKDRG
jgi:hypothetical protein